jgi:flagellin-like hook-associated protein FlgL
MMDRVSPAGIAIGRQSNLQSLQSQLARAIGETSSGRKEDPTRDMGVAASLLYQLHDDIQQGTALQNSTSLAGGRMKTMQTAMSSIATMFQDMSAQILQADVLKQESYTNLATDTPDVMASIADLLNTDFQGQKIFGGTDSVARPLSNIDTLPAQMRALMDTAVANNGGAPLDAAAVAGLISDIDSFFAGPGFAVHHTSASKTADGDPNLVRIGEGQTMAYDVRADNPAFKDALHALALTSLLGSPATSLTSEAKVALAGDAGKLMRGAQASLTIVAGTLGTKEARLERVGEIQTRAIAAATIQINDLEGADYYTLSDQINTMKIQLEATYSITAKMADLSLVKFL